jgi:hypothetical protein
MRKFAEIEGMMKLRVTVWNVHPQKSTGPGVPLSPSEGKTYEL